MRSYTHISAAHIRHNARPRSARYPCPDHSRRPYQVMHESAIAQSGSCDARNAARSGYKSEGKQCRSRRPRRCNERKAELRATWEDAGNRVLVWIAIVGSGGQGKPHGNECESRLDRRVLNGICSSVLKRASAIVVHPWTSLINRMWPSALTRHDHAETLESLPEQGMFNIHTDLAMRLFE